MCFLSRLGTGLSLGRSGSGTGRDRVLLKNFGTGWDRSLIITRLFFHASKMCAIDSSHKITLENLGQKIKTHSVRYWVRKPFSLLHNRTGMNSNLLRNRWLIAWCHPVYSYYEIDDSLHDVILLWMTSLFRNPISKSYFEIRAEFHCSNWVYKGST